EVYLATVPYPGPSGGTVSFSDDGTVNPTTATPLTQTFTATVPLSGYFTTSSIPFTTNDGSDAFGGSGIDTSTRLTEPAAAPSLARGRCPSPGSPTFGSFTGNTAASPTDTSSLADNCYRYRFSIADRVGNRSSYVTTDVKVDTTAPANTPSITGATGAFL